jgi:hypothetical protein
MCWQIKYEKLLPATVRKCRDREGSYSLRLLEPNSILTNFFLLCSKRTSELSDITTAVLYLKQMR